MKTFRDLVHDAKQIVPEVTVEEVHTRLTQGAPLAVIDVRDPDEYREGAVEGAVNISRGFLEFKVQDAFPDPETPLVLYCMSGLRSLLAAKALHDLGYRNVASMAGGVRRWRELRLPLVKDEPLTQAQMERYSRHFMLAQVGERGQKQLLRAKVLLIGAGGLGSPTGFYLAAAGVGTLGIIDSDVVDLSNLQRQILHRTADLARPKVESARDTIQALNPDVTVVPYADRLTVDNIERIIKDYDIVVDGSDNFATRYLVNDACVKLGLPNVHGSIYRFEGQVSVFWPGYPVRRGPCYRCLYPSPPPPELAPSCAEAGVLGVLPGVIGTLEAVEVIKLLLGLGDPLVGRLLHYDALRQRFTELTVAADPKCAWCAEGAEFPGYVDYEQFCAASAV